MFVTTDILVRENKSSITPRNCQNVAHSSYQAPAEILGTALDSITNQFASSCDETRKQQLPSPLRTPEEDKEEEEIQEEILAAAKEISVDVAVVVVLYERMNDTEGSEQNTFSSE